MEVTPWKKNLSWVLASFMSMHTFFLIPFMRLVSFSVPAMSQLRKAGFKRHSWIRQKANNYPAGPYTAASMPHLHQLVWRAILLTLFWSNVDVPRRQAWNRQPRSLRMKENETLLKPGSVNQQIDGRSLNQRGRWGPCRHWATSAGGKKTFEDALMTVKPALICPRYGLRGQQGGHKPDK